MLKEIKFALYTIKKNIQSSAELRTSFLMNIFGMAINNTAFIILWGYFVVAVGNIGGWTVADVIALQGFTGLCYGFVFSAFRGLRKIPEYVSSGAFDRFMLAPKNLLLRVATSSFGVSAIGDIVFGIICLVIYGILIKISIIQVLIMLLMIIISTIIFLAAVIIIYSLSFYFTDANSVTSSLFEFFLTPSLFHGGAFQGNMRFFFTFIIPSLLIGSIPVEITKSVELDQILLIGSLSVLWMAFSIFVFYKSIKKYESSNFMTFGN